MATEEAKLVNRTRLWGLTTVGMTLGIWDFVQESATALSPTIGDSIVKEMEKSLGLEIAGEKPEHVLTELGRIFVDEYGYAAEAKVEKTNKGFNITLIKAIGIPEYIALRNLGVGKPFSHPFLCACLSVLARLEVRARADIIIDETEKNEIVTLEIV
jgi:hypothetical protein